MADTISGVTLLNGLPTQARVTLIDVGANVVAASQLSDASTGAWSFGGLAAGTYEVLIVKAGYKAQVDGPWALDGVSAISTLWDGARRGFWLDPSDTSTLWQDAARTVPVTALGQPVGCIDDKSGNGHFFSQATASKRPTWRQDAFGHHYLEFVAASQQWLSAGNTDTLAPRTDEILLVAPAAILDSATRPIVARSIATGAGGRYALRRVSPNSQNAMYDDGDGIGAVEAIFAYSATDAHVYSGVAARASNQLYERIDGAQVASIGAGNDTGVDRRPVIRTLIGAYGNSSDTGEAFYMSGSIYGVVALFAPSIAGSDISTAENWSAQACGVPLA